MIAFSMTLFWLTILLLLLGAMAFICIPALGLFKKEPLVGIVMVLIALILSIGSLALYREWGSSQELSRLGAKQALLQQIASDTSDAKIILQRLMQAAKEMPDDAEIGFLLGRFQMLAGQYEAAALTYKAWLEKLGRAPELLAQYAQALYFLHGQQLTAPIQNLLEETLSQDPNETTALSLLGIAAFEAKDYLKAIEYWQRILKVQPDIETAQALQHGIDKAKGYIGQEGNAALTQSATIQVKVELAPQVSTRVKPEHTVFVFARAVVGPPMPVAVARIQVRDLPLTVTLDDNSAMSSELRLSSVDQVRIGARVSPSGNAIAQPGDWQGYAAAVVSTKENAQVKVIIAEQVKH